MAQTQDAVPGGEPGAGQELAQGQGAEQSGEADSKVEGSTRESSRNWSEVPVIRWRAMGTNSAASNSPAPMVRVESRNQAPAASPRAERFMLTNSRRCFCPLVSWPARATAVSARPVMIWRSPPISAPWTCNRRSPGGSGEPRTMPRKVASPSSDVSSSQLHPASKKGRWGSGPSTHSANPDSRKRSGWWDLFRVRWPGCAGWPR
jgi:hypothetical protein